MPEQDETIGQDENLVGEGARCPQCGENRMDYLAWDKDFEQVTCQTCGKVYTP